MLPRICIDCTKNAKTKQSLRCHDCHERHTKTRKRKWWEKNPGLSTQYSRDRRHPDYALKAVAKIAQESNHRRSIQTLTELNYTVDQICAALGLTPYQVGKYRKELGIVTRGGKFNGGRTRASRPRLPLADTRDDQCHIPLVDLGIQP